MDERAVARLLTANDPLLAPLIRAGSEDERRMALERVLVQSSRPIIDRVLARYRHSDRLLGAQEAEDIAGTVMLRLLRRLQEVACDEAAAVERLADFAATLTFNALYDFMRRSFPERTRLKNQVRYVATRDERFRTWTAPHGVVCSLASWPVTTEVGEPVSAWSLARRGLERAHLGDALETILHAAAKPLLVDHVVQLLADLWSVVDLRMSSGGEVMRDAAVSPATQLEKREYMATLWREIRDLRGPQRAALLLNLRDGDGGNAAALFVLMEVATLDEVAQAMDVTPERLGKVWNDLPLDDLAIASMLGTSRQQVINLRKSARERLARRMREQ
ncbi:MAG: hypothetical protein QOH21_2118 [Acidobacteriota bacterium]|jgi:hypothetical protein|nr:hypothetical protein [Acidobacteriota bacterium]